MAPRDIACCPVTSRGAKKQQLYSLLFVIVTPACANQTAQRLVTSSMFTVALPWAGQVIDPEFAFYGPMGFDLGALIGNLLMAYCAVPGNGQGEEYAEWLLEQVRRRRSSLRRTINEKGEIAALCSFAGAIGSCRRLLPSSATFCFLKDSSSFSSMYVAVKFRVFFLRDLLHPLRRSCIALLSRAVRERGDC